MALELVNKLPYDHPYRWDGTAVGGQKLWRPDELGTSLALWLDAEDENSITLNGTDVSQWDDKSGNGYDLLQATSAEQPEYIASGLNGKPTIRTDGSERLSSTTTSLFRNVSSATWVAVAKYVNTPVGNAMLLYCSTGANASQTRLGLTANPTGGTFLGVGGRRLDSDSYTTALSSTATSTILNSWFIEVGQGDYANAEANHWTDGAQDLTSSSFLTSGNTDDTDPLFVSVFTGPPGAPSAPAGTEIAEVIAIEGPLTTEDHQKLEGYLAWKWGLEANLPVGHPYKSTPPTV